ncbi:MAG: RNA-binding protein [Chitinophagaceae bacterium]|nr:RNA-binding protein [Chitinophagaceae bacterium]
MNIYVSNLSFHTTEETLKTLFAQYGNVSSVRLITDKFTGSPRGFGFIEMSSEEEGNAAITGLNNKDVEGRSLAVSVARPKPDNNTSGRRW